MFCSNCGTKIEDGAKFCHNCGAPVASNTAPAEAAAPVSAPERDIPAAPFQINVPEQPITPAEDIQLPEIPVPSFAAPVVTPGEIVLPEAPVFEMPSSVTEPEVQSVYTDPETALMPEVNAHPDAQTFPANDYDQRPQTEVPTPEVEPQPLYRPAAQPEAVQTQPQVAPQSVYQQVVQPQAQQTQPQPQQPYYQPAQQAPAQAQSASQQTSQTTAFGTNPYAAAQNAAGQAYTPAQPAAPAAPEKTRKKGGAVRAIAIFAVLALIAVGWWFFMGPGSAPKEPVISGPEDVEDYLLGKQAFDDGDFLAAEEYLERAWDVLPDSSDIGDMLFETYRQLVLQFTNEHDYINAEPRALKFSLLAEKGPEAIMPAFYSQWISEILLGTAEGDLKAIGQRAAEYLTQEQLDFIENYDPNSTGQTEPADLNYDDIALLIAEAADEKNWYDACKYTYIYDWGLKNVIADSQNGYVTVAVSGHDYGFVRYYYNADEDIVYSYYGNLDTASGDRDGLGYIFSVRNSDDGLYLYYYLSQWSGDMPNGKFMEICRRGSEFTDYETYEGSTINGKYDGEVNWIRGGVTYLPVYDNGTPQVIRRDENGYYVIAEATDGSDKYLYLFDEPDSSYQAGLELAD